MILDRAPLNSPRCGSRMNCHMIATATAEVSTGRKNTVRKTGRMRRCTDSISAASGNVIEQVERHDEHGEQGGHLEPVAEVANLLRRRVGEVEHLAVVGEPDVRVVATEPADRRAIAPGAVVEERQCHRPHDRQQREHREIDDERRESAEDEPTLCGVVAATSLPGRCASPGRQPSGPLRPSCHPLRRLIRLALHGDDGVVDRLGAVEHGEHVRER